MKLDQLDARDILDAHHRVSQALGSIGFTGSSELSVGDRVLVGGCG